MTRTIELAVIAGDGIGTEVVEQGLLALDAALAGSDVTVRTTDFDLGRERSERLYESGRRAAAAFFDGDGTAAGWDFARYVERYRASRPGRRIRIEAAQEHLLAM